MPDCARCWWPCNGRRFETNLPIAWFSLQFLSPGIEQGFMNSVHARMVANASKVGVAAWLFFGAHGLFFLIFPAHEATEIGRHIEKRRNMIEILMSLLGALLATASFAQLRWGLISPTAFEILLVCFSLAYLPCGILSETWYMAKVYGISDPDDVVGWPLSGTWLPLWLTIVTEIVHISLHVRWLVAVPVQLAVAFLYPVLEMSIGTPHGKHGGFEGIAISIAALVLLSTVGKREIDILQRKAYITVILERTQRANAEFKLEMMSERSLEETSTSRKSGEVSSLDSGTVGSSTIFENIDTEAMEIPLGRLMRMGYKEHWLIAAETVFIDPSKVLGEGGFGRVLLGDLHGSPVALKASKAANSMQQVKYITALMNELRVLRHVRHVNIALFHGAIVQDTLQNVMIVMELVHGPTLEKFVKYQQPSDINRFHIILCICRALRYLHAHEPQIVHGDLKPSNIMVENVVPGRTVLAKPKLLDFGLSRVLSRPAKPLGGSLRWMAPEVYRGMGNASALCTAADVFSFGRVMHFTVTAKTVMANASSREVRKALKAYKTVQYEWDGNSALITPCRDVAESCTNLDFAARPSITRIYSDLYAWPLIPGLEELEHCLPSGIQQSQSLQSCDDNGSSSSSREPLQLRLGQDGSPRSSSVHSQSLPIILEEHADQVRLEAPTNCVKETPMSTRVIMLLSSAARWMDLKTGCCEMHDAVRQLAHASRICEAAHVNKPCAELGRASAGKLAQCSRCFVLELARNSCENSVMCDVCNDGCFQSVSMDNSTQIANPISL